MISENIRPTQGDIMAISFQKMGDGAPLVIIHGLFGTSDNLRSVARELADSHTVYLIDAPGHGDSDKALSYTLEEMAKIVLSFLDENQLNDIAILGHSLGGKISMEIALLEPERISKLLVADIAPVQYHPRHDDIIAGLKSVPLDNLSNRGEADKILSQKIPEFGVRSFLLKSLARVKESNKWFWRFDLEGLSANYPNLIKANRNGKFENPVMFIRGSESNYIKDEHREDIMARFKKVSAKTISGAGHWLHAERPVAFVKICRDFLNQ